ncbi:BREX-1 system phosphatase PglZ type A [Desulfobacterales bacterium HSG17]|nr:BREX-1 system phosphatase PglZ type A [Desulfobacterales bacterium HSG17]
MNKIAQALEALFERHRIVFWYDEKKELWDEYESLEIEDIEKIEITNNQFMVKHRILRQEPDTKFLLYHQGPRPADIDNWLLDVQLAYGNLRADQSAIRLSEMGLGLEFIDIINEHAEFFNLTKFRESLKKLLKPDDTQTLVRKKMLAVCAASDPRPDAVIESLLAELAEKKEDRFKLIKNCSLESFLWNLLEKRYEYKSQTPGIQDFAIQLFKSCYEMNQDNPLQLNTDAIVFLKRWKNNIRQQKAFETLSKECAEILNIEKDLHKRDISSLKELDYFELIDMKILGELAKNVVNQTISSIDRENLIRQRKLSHWYEKYKDLYQAIDFGARFINALEQAELAVESMQDGICKYTKSWFILDQFYRKYIYHSRKSGQVSMLDNLSDKVENLYSNNFLLALNNNWQKIIDKCHKWESFNIDLQRHFFRKKIYPFLRDKKKVIVIISDALRFEAGEELNSLIRKEDRFEAVIEPMLTMLPSFTGLGMASLLPNREIKFADNDPANVLVDGQSSRGTENRSKIIDSNVKGRARAMTARELREMNKTQCRELFREHDQIYIFHDRIDAIGDKKESEERVFDAVEETFGELIEIVKKLTGANASNLIITSDHGFIYQNRAIEESDFISPDKNIKDENVMHRSRRFLLGKNLHENSSMKKFTSCEAGIEGDMDILIPKSINRIRIKGAGSRFVHGGASLQEIVIPVIKINKKRKSDISQVRVDFLGSSTSVITTGQLSVSFYQADPVTAKKQPRTLWAGIYSKEGETISDSHEICFDFTSENPRDREKELRFVLTQKADDLNGQEVFLRLEEKVAGTSHYREYKSLRYEIRRSIVSDFDF